MCTSVLPRGVASSNHRGRAVVGEIEEDLDEKVDYESLKALPLNPVVH